MAIGPNLSPAPLKKDFSAGSSGAVGGVGEGEGDGVGVGLRQGSIDHSGPVRAFGEGWRCHGTSLGSWDPVESALCLVVCL
jgi:hypothetical protein